MDRGAEDSPGPGEAAYGMRAKDVLLALYGDLADREASMRPVVGPGLPPSVKNTNAFVTDDRISYD
jgi:hypothetical protein